MTDERDHHDPALDKAWRAHVRDEPPEALDQRVLAAAHRAVQSGPRAAGSGAAPRWRAWAPLAVAATLGVIAFGVVELLPRETPSQSAVVSDVPVAPLRKDAAPVATPPVVADQVQNAPPAAAPATAAPPATAPAQPERDAARKTAPRELAQRPPAPQERAVDKAEAADRAASSSGAMMEHKERAQAAEPQAFAAAPRSKITAAAAPEAAPPVATPAPPPLLRAQSAPAKVVAPRTPDEFVHEIERLRAEHRDADAALALSAFRAAYPDADTRLPASLRDWARTVTQP